jgi:hypothetical protein
MKTVRKTRSIPFEFVLEKLDRLRPVVRPMFGCFAIYSNEKMLLILRKKEQGDRDNGVWVATTPEHHETLAKQFPSLRSIHLFGEKTSAWQNLPEEADDFEESVNEICEMILKGDVRIGKTPKPKRKKK